MKNRTAVFAPVSGFLSHRTLGGSLLAFTALAFTACQGGRGDVSDSPTPGTPVIKAATSLPPGNWSTVTLDGLLLGTATGNPGDFGEHLDDQRLDYWSFRFKDGTLGTRPGEAITPKDGVSIYLDDFGVPIIYADTIFDTYYGMGYAAATQRLFLLDAARRLGRGTLSELAGCGNVPADIATRVQTYTEAEYMAMYDALGDEAKESIQGLVAGINDYISELTLDAPNLPAEYVVLTSLPEPVTIADIAAEGVLITRSVAAEGGNEFSNIKMLQGLQARYGDEAGIQRFLDLVWDDDAKAVTTVPASEGTFRNQSTPADGREAVFREVATWATDLPDTLWKGIGTGDEESPCTEGLPLKAEMGSGTRKLAPGEAQAALQNIRNTLDGLRNFRINRGSFAFAISGERTRDGGGLLVSEPQLGYGYPTQLWEVEVHGPGIDARGSTVPGLPAVGIGYTENLAWGLTTGYSKTVDSFIETICSTAQQSDGTCSPNQYLFNGEWQNMDCRTETVSYRTAPQGVPVLPDLFSSDYEVCRTAHGPIVARDDEAGLARSLAYFMWNRELDNIEGVQAWSRATNAAEFIEATRKVTWNENVTYATKDGDIGYIHPGYFPERHPRADQRFPTPGDGTREWVGVVPFESMPQVHNPAQGYLANWNNKPAVGWFDGEGLGSTSRPGGPNQRVTSILDQLSTMMDVRYEDLFAIERVAGSKDHRYREFIPLFEAWASRNVSFGTLVTDPAEAVEATAALLVLSWDGVAFDPNMDIEDENATDTAPTTIFGAWVEALRDILFADLRAVIIDADAEATSQEHDAFHRIQGVGSHVYDHSVMDNLIVRILDPSRSALGTRVNYLGDRSGDELITEALQQALATLGEEFGTGYPDNAGLLALYRRQHPRSSIENLTGLVGPSTTMPYVDRGSWIHVWAAESP